MARRAKSAGGQVERPVGIQQYVKLEERLILLSWLNDLFGFVRNRDLLSEMKGTSEGRDSSGRSFLYHQIIARGSRVKISPADLARYDDNVQAHLRAMNAQRAEPITLRYFQMLAALYAEVFLDRYFNRRAEMLRSLNAFVAARNAARFAGEPQDTPFLETDLKKLAFWMATGSGKTLIMHLNYRQFLHYCTERLDNILLISPNEGMTEQHLAELEASNIPARRFDLNESGLDLASKGTVRLIEITKLVEEKRGGGVTVPVEAFEGNNLIFVDEGHKGSHGEVWRGYRDALGETGFTFEYSATFGQALTAARNDILTTEYGKAIVFDYSYRYFHGDGYGKDFRVLNLKQETTEKQTETLLLGNLLSFYEQQLVFDEKASDLRPYYLERPLWVFVGSTVNAVYTEDKEKRSDVLTVVRFLHHALGNNNGWVTKAIKRLLEGKSGLITAAGADVFEGRFNYLKDRGFSPEELYQDVLEEIFHSPSAGSLHLCEVRNGTGELGLKVGGAEGYFGLIYIGDTGAFKALVEGDIPEIVMEEDTISGSLFGAIANPDTTIEILIGAKKFMEGWNSWRVSAMGLLNIGRQEGSQIIQLFGRGVRLRGKDSSLKRSSALSGPHPAHVDLLETLNIFAVRANFMAQFRAYLEKEGVETGETIELPLLIRTNKEFLRKGLMVPRVPEDRDFTTEIFLVLDVDPAVLASVDMSARVEAIQSRPEGFISTAGQSGQVVSIPEEALSLVDWERVYLDLIEYKERRGFANLIIPRDSAEQIIRYKNDKGLPLYRLVADESVVKPISFYGRTALQEAVTNIVRNYIDDFYRTKRETWETRQMVYKTLSESDPNIKFGGHVKEDKPEYVVNIQRSKKNLVSSVQRLIADAEKLYQGEDTKLPRIHFDRHLYLPLLVEHGDEIKMTPPGLNEGEAQFVRDLKEYWASEKDNSLAGYQVYLLRNLSRGRGIGFFEERGFYPDFIMWIVGSQKQAIVFVEPHGMLSAKAYQHDEKARLHEALPALAKEIAARSKTGKHVRLDSYIISATKYEDLYEKYENGSWGKNSFAEKHILFLERNSEYDYIQIMLSRQLRNRQKR